VHDVSTPLLFDDSRRVFLWGALQGEKLGLDYDPDLLDVGAMFHDIGLIRAIAPSTSGSRSTARTPPVSFSTGMGFPRSAS